MKLEQYSAYRQIYSRDIPALLARLLREKTWTRMLDIGCGDGRLLYALREAGLMDGKEILAVDVAPERVALASAISPCVRAWVDDACNLEGVEDASVDFVVSTGVISQVPDDARMVAEVSRVLRPGGTAFLTTVRKRWFGWYFYRARGQWVIDPMQAREYRDPEELLRLFRGVGMRVTHCEQHALAFPIADFVARKLGADHRVFDKGWLEALRVLKVPIPGYCRLWVAAEKPA